MVFHMIRIENHYSSNASIEGKTLGSCCPFFKEELLLFLVIIEIRRKFSKHEYTKTDLSRVEISGKNISSKKSIIETLIVKGFCIAWGRIALKASLWVFLLIFNLVGQNSFFDTFLGIDSFNKELLPLSHSCLLCFLWALLYENGGNVFHDVLI